MKWTKDKDDSLISLINSGKTYQEISYILDTSFRSVTNRCLRLGLKQFSDNKIETNKCLTCNHYFESKKSDNRKFCSRRCSVSFNNKKRKHSEETKKKIKESLSKTKSILRNNCIKCGSQVRKKTAKYCSKLCLHSCEIYKDNLRRKTVLRYKINPEEHPNRKCAGMNESYPERMFREFLIDNGLRLGIDFMVQYYLEGYYIDFYFPIINLSVEIDGERWHNKHDEKEINRENTIKKFSNLIRFDVKPLIKKKYEKKILEIISKVKSIISSEAEH
jgi:very-short-patch-repair endonuclease/endogenous inhibitor of DNA gyrase (YacG/DUF329 family)